MKSYDLVETLHDSEMFKPYKCSSIQVYSWGIFTSSTSSTSSGLDSHVTSRDPDRYVELLYTFLVPPLGVVECPRPTACNAQVKTPTLSMSTEQQRKLPESWKSVHHVHGATEETAQVLKECPSCPLCNRGNCPCLKRVSIMSTEQQRKLPES